MTSSANERQGDGRVLGGRYELEAKIGSGASAITWRGRDRRLDRAVAIKVVRPEYAEDRDFANRFDREARTAAALSHPNVVEIFDVGVDGETHYLVMQLVDGEDVKRLIAREGPLGAERSRDIVVQMLAGLQAIHRAGIIHRDIKPQNVLIDRDGVVKVTDFGVAQDAQAARLTAQGMTLGTAAYMAPEQANGSALSEATDLYAAGVMLYEMLTGQLPFTDANPVALLRAHVEQVPASPSEARPDLHIPAAFDGIVMQALAKNPQHRFRTAQAMARALQGASLEPAHSAQTMARTARVTPQADYTRPLPVDNSSRSGTTGRTRVQPRPVAPPPDSRQGSTFGLWVLLIAIVVMLGAIGVYAWDTYLDDDASDPTPPATQTQTTEDEFVNPPADASADDEDDGQQVIEPVDDGYEDIIDEPTMTPEPTATLESTEPPAPTATEPLIVPDSGMDDEPPIEDSNGESPETTDGGDGGIIEPGD